MIENELDVREIKPGILVTETVSITGGIEYVREEETSYFEDKSKVRQWRTTSRIDDVEEREEALRVRARIYSLVRTQCVKTPIGLICPLDNQDALREALVQVREVQEEFNRSASTCIVKSHHALFEARGDNQDAISAILEQVAEVANRVDTAITADDFSTLQSAPKRWLKGMNPQAILLLPEDERNAVVARCRAELIRNAIKDIKGVESLLPNSAGKEVKEVAKKSRNIARMLCKRVEKHSEALDGVLNEVDLSGVRRSKAAFVLAATKADNRARDIVAAEAPKKKLVVSQETDS